MLVLSHRGLPGAGRPENTVAAVLAALDAGADGVELDLRLTSDGVLAVCHDPDLARLAGAQLTVGASRWEALEAAAAGAGVRLARLEHVLVVSGGRRVVLELKDPPGGPRSAVARTAEVLADRVRELDRAGVPLHVTVSSFSAPLVGAVRALLPPGSGVRTALLGRPTDRAGTVLRRALDGGHDEVHPHVTSLLAQHAMVAAAHACGTAVVPWTVNRRRDVRRLHRLGVDGLITDQPAAARAAVAGARA